MKPQEAPKQDFMVALKEKRITVRSLEKGPLFLLPEKREIMCLLSDNTLVVSSGDKTKTEVRAYIALLAHKGIKPTIRETSATTIKRLYTELGGVAAQEGASKSSQTSNMQKDVIALFNDAVRRKASDVHITIYEEHGEIAFRIHGDLYRMQAPPRKKVEEMCATIYQSMCDIADPIYKPNTHQDARMSADFVARCGLFGARIASGPTGTGSSMVIRLLYSSGSSAPSLKDLGYLPEQVGQMDNMRQQTSGVSILSGATGSGKSTTLVSVLDRIVRDARSDKKLDKNNDVEQFLGISIRTIEDPPEYKIEGVIQTPLIADKSDPASIRQGWARGISSAMRQDPDILMIGEIRDPDSAKAAFDAALTGHGVWTTVHTTDAVGVMLRLDGLQIDKDRMLDPEIIIGLINQSLAQKLCPYCSVPWAEKREALYKERPTFVKRIEDYCEVEGVRLKGPGCPKCKGEGIAGRVVIAEVITPTLEFMEQFSEHGKARAKKYWVESMAGITKCMSLIRRINQGIIDPMEGEDKICPLDNDKRRLSLDYSKEGPMEDSRERTLAQAHFKLDREIYADLDDVSDLYFNVYKQRNERASTPVRSQ